MLAPWKKSYNQPRQHIKKQRHHFADKGTYSQSYGFSSSHVWMWELDYKESWAVKNWCFWTVVPLESPLETKEIKPVNAQGNQPWIFTGRTDAETEAPIFWPPDAKSWLIGKDPDAGKDWRQEEKGATEDEMIGWHHWVNGHEFEQALGDSEGQGIPVCCSPWGCKESNTTEQLNSDNHVEEEMGVKRSLKTTGPTRAEVGLSSVQLSHLSACCQIFFLIHSIYHSYSSYEGLLFLLL